jgi:uncharacterized protein (DUF433 family)
LLKKYPLIDKTKDIVGGQFRLADTRLPLSHILACLIESDIYSIAHNYQVSVLKIQQALELAADILENIE